MNANGNGNGSNHNHSTGTPALNAGDQLCTCIDAGKRPQCEKQFVFTVGEQKFFNEKGFTPPKRCKPCRDAKRAEKEASGGGYSSGGGYNASGGYSSGNGGGGAGGYSDNHGGGGKKKGKKGGRRDEYD